MSETYAGLMHHYTCIAQNIYMLQIYACQKYMHVRNICILEIYTFHKYMHLFSEIYDG